VIVERFSLTKILVAGFFYSLRGGNFDMSSAKVKKKKVEKDCET